MKLSHPSSSVRALAQAERPNRLVDCGCSTRQREHPDECFREGSETRPNFSLFFFFFSSQALFHGQFSQDEPIIIPQRCLPPPNPMGGLSEGRKEEEKKRKSKKKKKLGHTSIEIRNYKKTQKTTTIQISGSHPICFNLLSSIFLVTVVYCF